MSSKLWSFHLTCGYSCKCSKGNRRKTEALSRISEHGQDKPALGHWCNFSWHTYGSCC